MTGKLKGTFKCLFGFHKWTEYGGIPNLERQCDRCGKVQENCYDGIKPYWRNQ